MGSLRYRRSRTAPGAVPRSPRPARSRDGAGRRARGPRRSRRWPPVPRRLRVRAEVLVAGGPPLWAELMAELRAIHLGTAAPDRTSPSVIERLAEAYAAAR